VEGELEQGKVGGRKEGRKEGRETGLEGSVYLLQKPGTLKVKLCE